MFSTDLGWQIRTAGSRQGCVTSIQAKLYKYETKLTLPRWQEKMTRCCVALKQASTLPGLGINEFELTITDVSLLSKFALCDVQWRLLNIWYYFRFLLSWLQITLSKCSAGGWIWRCKLRFVHASPCIRHLCCRCVADLLPINVNAGMSCSIKESIECTEIAKESTLIKICLPVKQWL